MRKNFELLKPSQFGLKWTKNSLVSDLFMNFSSESFYFLPYMERKNFDTSDTIQVILLSVAFFYLQPGS